LHQTLLLSFWHCLTLEPTDYDEKYKQKILNYFLRYGNRSISEDLKNKRNQLATKVLKELLNAYDSNRIGIRVCKGPLGSKLKKGIHYVSTEVGTWMRRFSDESSISHDILTDWEPLLTNSHSTLRHVTTCLSHYLSVEDEGQSIIGGWSVSPNNPSGQESNSSNCYDGKHKKANSPITMRDWSKSINLFLMGNY